MDVELVLNRLQASQFVRLHKKTGNYMTCYCPFHNGGQERKPSCGVLLKEEWRGGQRYQAGWWHCFSCGYTGTMVDAVTEMLKSRSITQSGLDWLRVNIPDFDQLDDFEYLVPENLMESVSNSFAIDYIKSKTAQQQTYVSEEELASYRFVVPYMYARKLTDEIIEKFDIGYDGKWIPPGRSKPVPCITIPIRDIYGRTLFLCRRSIEGKLYNYPTGVVKPVFGIDMIPASCKSVIICESAINALTCWTWGYPAVALLGTGNSYQIQQLKELGVSEYVICMDGDEAGEKATAKLLRQLRSNALLWTIHMTPGKDVNDCTKEEFMALYDARD